MLLEVEQELGVELEVGLEVELEVELDEVEPWMESKSPQSTGQLPC